jgi:hypothetical protein
MFFFNLNGLKNESLIRFGIIQQLSFAGTLLSPKAKSLSLDVYTADRSIKNLSLLLK